MAISGNYIPTEQNNQYPSIKIGVSLPNGNNNNYIGSDGNYPNWSSPPTMHGDVLSSVQQERIDQQFDMRVYLYPGDDKIFNLNPEIWLFRQIRRNTRNAHTFLTGGNKILHPTHQETISSIIPGRRYYGGSHNYLNYPRITEVPLNDNNKQFYGGSNLNITGTPFPFMPIAWFNGTTNLVTTNNITFPQPLNETSYTGTFPAGIGIYQNNLYDLPTGTIVNFKYGNSKQKFKFYFAFALVIDNPKYDGGTQEPIKIVISNLAWFALTYKVANLIDDADGILKKYAIDWGFRLGAPI